MAARAPKPNQRRPLRDLETDGATVIEQVRRTGETVVLTEGNEPTVVLMTAAQFEELTDRARVVAAIDEGLADVAAGSTMTTAELKAELEKKHGPIPWR